MNWWTRFREFLASIPRFFREVRSEMSKVSFPSKDEVMGTTMVVLATSFVFAFYLWLADLVIVQLFKVIGS
jgi:preprotein translocase subunit SecE